MRSRGKLPWHARAVTALVRLALHLLYNQLAWAYDMVSWMVSLGHWKEWVWTTLPILEEASGAGRILELGHGPGHLQLEMLSRGWRAAGLDLSPSMGKIARRRLAGLPGELARGRTQALPFGSGNFWAVVATFPSEYIAETRAIEEIRRVLIAGGQLIVLPYAWITGDSWAERALAWLFRVSGEAPEMDNPTFQGWVSDFLRSMRNCGFQVSTQEIALESSRVMIIIGQKV